jgi:putative endonuclease
MPLGARGEKLARQFLKRAGYRIIQTNYICPIGEIDIVAADGDSLVFVEVKTRQSDAEGDPEESVHFHKKCKVTKVARHFIAHHNAHNMAARFDVIAILVPDSGQPSITHFADAFPPTPR